MPEKLQSLTYVYRSCFYLTTWKAWILNISDVCTAKMLEQLICFNRQCLNNCNTWTAVTPKQLCDWTAVSPDSYDAGKARMCYNSCVDRSCYASTTVMLEQLCCLNSWQDWAAVMLLEQLWRLNSCVTRRVVVLEQLWCLNSCDAWTADENDQLWHPQLWLRQRHDVARTAVLPEELLYLNICDAWTAATIEQLRRLNSCKAWYW